MRIPKYLGLEEFKLFIFTIAEKVGVRLKSVEFNPQARLGGASAAATLDNRIILRIPICGKYETKPYLPFIIHEIAHLKQRQDEGKWGHNDLSAVIQGIYQSLGWSNRKLKVIC